MLILYSFLLLFNKMALANCPGDLMTHSASDPDTLVDALLFVDRTASGPHYVNPGGWSDYFYLNDPISCNVEQCYLLDSACSSPYSGSDLSMESVSPFRIEVTNLATN